MRWNEKYCFFIKKPIRKTQIFPHEKSTLFTEWKIGKADMSGSLFGNFVMKNKFCSLFFYSSILYVFMDLSYIPIYFPTGAKFIEDLFLDHIIIPIVSKINQYMSSKKFPIYLKSLNVWNFIPNNFHGYLWIYICTLKPRYSEQVGQTFFVHYIE